MSMQHQAHAGRMQHHWSPWQLYADRSWSWSASAQLIGEFSHLETQCCGRVDDLTTEQVCSDLFPALHRLGAHIRHQLGPQGLGIAKITGLPTRPSLIATASVATGLVVGNILEPYGRLYSLYDRGGCYRSQAIPVSQTGKPIDFHTDSARRDVVPDAISLSCVRDAVGGNTRLVSMARVYERLLTQSHDTIDRLHQSYIRAIVTPGQSRSQENLLANQFPIFSADHESRKLTFRYMRYWIEKGQHLAGQPIDPWTHDALNWLDETLRDPALYYELHLNPGEIMWVDNRDIAHARTPHVDTDSSSRLLYRMWLTL